MSFLDKFKGKTQFLTKGEVSDILGSASAQQNKPPSKNLSASFAITLPDKQSLSKKNNKNRKQKSQILNGNNDNSPKQNPFYVSNPFYLDEVERERDERAKKQKQIKDRIERDRKKRLQIEARIAQTNKEWVHMGGLGPNLGGQQWTKKKELQSKMMKFAEEIKQHNFERLKCIPFMSYSQLNKQKKIDARSRALEYSRSVPRPVIMAGQRIVESLPRSQSRESMEQLEKLQLNHQKYLNLMKKF